MNAGRKDRLGSCLLKYKKLDLWVRLWSLTPSYNLDLEPLLGRCNSEPLKKSRNSCLQIIFEISCRKIPVLGSLFIKVAGLQNCNIFKKRLEQRCFLWILWTFQEQLFYRKPLVAAFESFTVQWSQLGCFLFDFAPSRAFELDQNLTQNVAQIILYYHVTKQFLSCLN